MNYDTMSDRELDAAVAEKVMGGADGCGFVCPKCGGTHFGSSTGTDGKIWSRSCHDEFGQWCHWSGPPIDAVERFSTDIAAAWQVVEKCRNINGVPCLVTVHVYAHGDRATLCTIETNADGERLGERMWVGRHGTAARAICLAALRALEWQA